MKKLLPLLILIFVFSCQKQTKTASQTNAKESEKVTEQVSPREEFLELLTIAKQLEAQGRSMENLRKLDDESALRECGNAMREHKQAAKDLKEKSNRLPPIYSTHLGSAAVELELCITCSPTALQRCDQAKLLIQEAEKQK